MRFRAALTRLERPILSALRPLTLFGREIGWLTQTRYDLLMDHKDLFAPAEGGGLTLRPRPQTPDQASALLRKVLDRLTDIEELKRFGSIELFPLCQTHGGRRFGTVERHVSIYLGMLGRGVHLNAVVHKKGVPHFWLAKRSDHLRYHPGLWDNAAAGGWALGQGACEAIRAEASEECGLPEAWFDRIRPTGAVSYAFSDDLGIRREQIFTFDINLPEDFTPRNLDNSVDAFELHPARDVIEDLVRRPERYKYNTPFVLLHWALANGLLTPDEEPDYSALVHALQNPRDLGMLPLAG